jgi:hypothetical protein
MCINPKTQSWIIEYQIDEKLTAVEEIGWLNP